MLKGLKTPNSYKAAKQPWRRPLRAGAMLLLLAGCISCGKKVADHVVTTRSLPAPAPIAVAPEPVAVRAGGGPDVRVAVLKDVQNVQIGVGAAGAVITQADGQAVKGVEGGATVSVIIDGNGLLVDGTRNVAGSTVRIQSRSSEPLKLITRDKGAVDCSTRMAITRMPGQTLAAIAHLEIDEYLQGVLAGEVPFNTWHPEALKAQAITSRSYALYQVKKSAAEPYDVESTIMSQVFKPGFQNHPILTPAVNGTRGLVLTSNNQIFSAYFHSTCGGSTENSTYVFPDHPATRALAGAPCPHCKASPHYRWRWQVNKDDLAAKLSGPQGKITKLDTIEFFDANGQPCGTRPGVLQRAATVRIRHSGGTFTMQGNQFRLAVSPRDLKSLYIEQVVDRGGALDIAGGGFGHGVGLCQFGSQGMALAGQTYPAILGQYFPGAALTKAY